MTARALRTALHPAAERASASSAVRTGAAASQSGAVTPPRARFTALGNQCWCHARCLCASVSAACGRGFAFRPAQRPFSQPGRQSHTHCHAAGAVRESHPWPGCDPSDRGFVPRWSAQQTRSTGEAPASQSDLSCSGSNMRMVKKEPAVRSGSEQGIETEVTQAQRQPPYCGSCSKRAC